MQFELAMQFNMAKETLVIDHRGVAEDHCRVAKCNHRSLEAR
jgi:hypothetical protein